LLVWVWAARVGFYGGFSVAAVCTAPAPRDRASTLGIAFTLLLLPGVVVFLTGRSARRRLRAQVVSARLYGILSGVFAVLAGLPLLGTVIGLLTVVAGLFTLTAALLLKRDTLRAERGTAA
jgi:hypothetical protein